MPTISSVPDLISPLRTFWGCQLSQPAPSWGVSSNTMRPRSWCFGWGIASTSLSRRGTLDGRKPLRASTRSCNCSLRVNCVLRHPFRGLGSKPPSTVTLQDAGHTTGARDVIWRFGGLIGSEVRVSLDDLVAYVFDCGEGQRQADTSIPCSAAACFDHGPLGGRRVKVLQCGGCCAKSLLKQAIRLRNHGSSRQAATTPFLTQKWDLSVF